MARHPLLFITFGLILALGVLHFFAVAFYLYWTVWWFDTTMHFLGGLSLGMLSLWLLHVSGIFGKRMPSKWQIFATSVIMVIFIGVGWEVFEYVFDIADESFEGSYVLDTIHDLIADICGAILAGVIGLKNRFYITEHNG